MSSADRTRCPRVPGHGRSDEKRWSKATKRLKRKWAWRQTLSYPKRQRTTGEITSVATISARPGKRKELVMTITSLLDPISCEQGCCGYRFYVEPSEEGSFVLIGEWETRSDWDRHMQSEYFAVLLGSLELLSNEKRLDFKLLSPVNIPNGIGA